MKLSPSTPALFSAVALLTACGGGGGSDSAAPPPPATTTSVNTAVIDGPLQNALVCLDKNRNGACDSGEPSARTAADGTASLTVAIADAGQYPLVAVVGTDAIDSVSGPVTVPYVLSTPADTPSVLSPLTTLVKAHMDATGLSSAAAEQALKDYAGIGIPLLTNYSAGTSDAAQAAGVGARLLVRAKQTVQTALQPTVGSNDSSGVAITQADVDGAINHRLLELLPSLADATNTVLDTPAGAARDAALSSAVASLATAMALTPSSLPLVLGLARAPAPVATTPTAGASLDWFTYADTGNWYFRLFAATAAQNTPDANGLLHFTEERKRAVGGVVQTFGDAAYTRTDMYFNGTQWFICPVGFEHAQTPRDANGVNDSYYCGAYHNKTRRSASIDIAGRSLSDVITQIRAYPLVSTQGLYPQWGPDPATPALAGAVFPAGSTLYQQTTTQLANPDSYGTLDSSIVKVFRADVAAGGTPVFTNGVPSVACGLVTSANFSTYQVQIATLEELVAGNPGSPCIFAANANTGPRNEWWGNSSISLGTVDGPAPALPAYQSSRSLRIAFTGGTDVAYYSCSQLVSGGSPRNCDPLGRGSYSIETVGDARVMRFADVPGDARPLSYNRLFVERGGKVYYGYRTKLGIDNTLRLNATAIDALLNPLGLSR